MVFFGSMCFFVSKISGKRVHLSSWNLQNRRAAALAIGSHRSLITSSLESTSRFIPSASPVLSRFTSSSTSQPISLIILALIIHHSFTLSLQAQNLHFQQILPNVDFFYLLDSSSSIGACRWRCCSCECPPSCSVLSSPKPWREAKIKLAQIFLHRS